MIEAAGIGCVSQTPDPSPWLALWRDKYQVRCGRPSGRRASSVSAARPIAVPPCPSCSRNERVNSPATPSILGDGGETGPFNENSIAARSRLFERSRGLQAFFVRQAGKRLNRVKAAEKESEELPNRCERRGES